VAALTECEVRGIRSDQLGDCMAVRVIPSAAPQPPLGKTR
jgi:hypothetical protein